MAGCSGGAVHNGAFHPIVPGTAQSGIPSNSPKVTLTFQVPARVVTRGKARTRGTAKARLTVVSTPRAPKYVSPAVLGGTATRQNLPAAGLKRSRTRPLTIGSLPSSAIYCSSQPSSSSRSTAPAANVRRNRSTAKKETEDWVTCTNTASVYAPLGSDTFFVEMFDGAQHLLSVTPGIPGTNFYGAAPSPVQVTPYGTYVTANTNGVVSNVWASVPTACAPFSGGYSTADLEFLDADGYQILGPFANPVGLSLPSNANGCGRTIYDLRRRMVAGTSDTIYEDFGGSSGPPYNEFAFPGRHPSAQPSGR